MNANTDRAKLIFVVVAIIIIINTTTTIISIRAHEEY